MLHRPPERTPRPSSLWTWPIRSSARRSARGPQPKSSAVPGVRSRARLQVGPPIKPCVRISRRHCNWRAFEQWTSAHRGGWYRSRRTCPHASWRRPHDHCRGPSLLPRSATRRSSVVRPPLTPAAPRLDFTVGLYEPRRPDLGLPRRVSRVPFASVHACCAPYPAETHRTYTPGPGCEGHGLHRDISGSALGL